MRQAHKTMLSINRTGQVTGSCCANRKDRIKSGRWRPHQRKYNAPVQHTHTYLMDILILSSVAELFLIFDTCLIFCSGHHVQSRIQLSSSSQCLELYVCACVYSIHQCGRRGALQEVCWGHVFPGRGVTLQAWRHEDINTAQCGSPPPTNTHTHRRKDEHILIRFCTTEVGAKQSQRSQR